jgi:hypothetical protein
VKSQIWFLALIALGGAAYFAFERKAVYAWPDLPRKGMASSSALSWD